MPLCLLSAIGGIWLLNMVNGLWFGLQIGWGWIPPPPVSVPPTFLDNNLFTQIGLVVLMGLACKNAILIVEFASQEMRKGTSALESAMIAAKSRFRPILMTAFSFILGVVPLLIASGAGAEARKVMGMTVFSGMLAATVIGVLVVPAMFVFVEKYVSKRKPATEGVAD